ncbi:MAG: glycosyltransferase [Hyphomicrobiaceae bacterium]
MMFTSWRPAGKWVRAREWRTPAAKLEVAYIRKSSAVVTVSDQLASRLNEIYGVRPLVIYNTPRSECLAPAGRHVRDDLKLGPETPLAVHTGQIASSRDIERFLHQMPRVPDLHFALVGMANKRMAARLGNWLELDISARVHFVPPVPYDDVSPYISSASFGVVPAVAASESQIVAAPGKLFEMMFAGLPVLMADMPQRRSMLERYGEGVIFPS